MIHHSEELEMINTTPGRRFHSYREHSFGFSLIELIIGLLLSAILLGALFTVLVRVQEVAASLSDAVDNRSNRHLAPLLLSQWVKSAGMNLFASPEAYLAVSSGELGVKADIKGNQGQPDGDTDDSFEDISFSARNEELKIMSGNGNYQPFRKGISFLRSGMEGRSLLRVEISGKQDYLDSARKTETRLLLWNTRANLFPEVQP